MVNEREVLETDVLIVGAGGARGESGTPRCGRSSAAHE